MKRILLVLGIAAALTVSAVGFAAASSGPIAIDSIQQWMKAGFYVGSAATASSTNKITRSLGNSATIDFTSAYAGRALSASITVTGALAGDPCFVGVPTAAAALKAKFGCVVDAADSVKVWFEPGDFTVGSVALTSASPSTATATVSASSICTCTPVGGTAAIAAAGCATGVSSTTLTLTGPNTVTTTMTYSCAAPVDPASGTYYVRVASSQ